MTPQNDPRVHVYHRIAERVSRELGTEVEPHLVESVIKGEIDTRGSRTAEAIMREAKEYGL